MRDGGARQQPRAVNSRAGYRCIVRPFALAAALCVLGLSLPAGATDRWTALAPGLRLLHRTTRHRDGAPLDMHVLEVNLCEPTLSLRVTAPDEGRTRTSRFGRRVGALAAVNGDYFDPRSIVPLGPTRGAGRDWAPHPPYFFGGLIAFRRGFSPTFFRTAPVPPEFTDVLPTQERIVHEGVVGLDPAIPHPGHRHPRSGYGITRDGRTMLVVVVDGRSSRSAGVSTLEYARLLVSLGLWEGIKLDGGGSTTLWVHDRGVVNRPSDGFERPVGNHLAFVSDPSAPNRPGYCAVNAPTAPPALSPPAPAP